jgi:hypothetical protein
MAVNGATLDAFHAGCRLAMEYQDEEGGIDGGLFLAAVHLMLVSALKELPAERQLIRAEEFSQKLLEAARKNIARRRSVTTHRERRGPHVNLQSGS